jgi:predicted SAM-dependent methyltransferase
MQLCFVFYIEIYMINNKYARRLKSSYAVIRFEISSNICSLIGILKSKLFFNKDRVNNLELGVGNSKRKKAFITSDISLKTDFPYDLRLGLPFPEKSIDFIYAEHVLEHFNYDELTHLLMDCYRVLKPSGILSLVVPNASIYLNAYFHPKDFDFKTFCAWDFGLSYKFKIDYVNYIFYMGGHHRYMFDEENILVILKDIGFNNVHLRNFDSNLDQVARKYESIYVECSK